MKILISIPQPGLLSPQGHMQRLEGLTSVLDFAKLYFLLPREESSNSSPRLPMEGATYYDHRRILGKHIPYLLDYSKSYRLGLKHSLKKFDPDIVLFDFPWGLRACKELAKRPTIYFSHGVESEFAEVTSKHIGIRSRPIVGILKNIIASIEKKACASANLIITMSKRDGKYFSDLYGIPDKKLLNFPQPVRLCDNVRKGDSPQTLLDKNNTFKLPANERFALFHGSYNHFPNREAIDFITNKLAPKAKGIFPNLRFLIAGTETKKFTNDNVTSLGFVENISELIEYSHFAIVPIFSGSGVRMKLFDYFKAGLPVITTQKGIEGIELKDEIGFLLANEDVDSFIAAIGKLEENPSLQMSLSENATKYLYKHHNPETLRNQLSSIFTELSESKSFSGKQAK